MKKMQIPTSFTKEELDGMTAIAHVPVIEQLAQCLFKPIKKCKRPDLTRAWKVLTEVIQEYEVERLDILVYGDATTLCYAYWIVAILWNEYCDK